MGPPVVNMRTFQTGVVPKKSCPMAVKACNSAENQRTFAAFVTLDFAAAAPYNLGRTIHLIFVCWQLFFLDLDLIVHRAIFARSLKSGEEMIWQKFRRTSRREARRNRFA